MNENDIYHEGMIAAGQELPASVCPFPSGSEEHAVWNRGYRAQLEYDTEDFTDFAAGFNNYHEEVNRVFL